MNTTIISTSVISAMNGAKVSNRVNAQLFGDDQPHMSSLQIAELSGKLHRHVMEAIRKMEPSWTKLAGSKFRLGSYRDANNQVRPCYELTKSECLFISTKFNDEARAKLVLRWEQLEMERLANQPMKLLTSAQEVLQESENIVAGQLSVLNRESDGCFTVRQIAEVYNMRPEDLNSFLVDQNIQRWSGGQYRLTPALADSGLAQDRTIYYYSLEGKIKRKTYLVWTERGRDFIMDMMKM
jgi:phage regulator Rha-like protein